MFKDFIEGCVYVAVSVLILYGSWLGFHDQQWAKGVFMLVIAGLLYFEQKFRGG